MPETISLPLNQIRTDGGTQPREYLNELVLEEYVEAMAQGVEFPPVTLFYDGAHYWLADGFHRFFAAKKYGVDALSAEMHQGTRRDAILFAAGANATHGLRRTNADKRRAVMTLLQDEEWQRWSNREMARQCGVTHTFVGKLRKEFLEGGQEPAAARMGRTGPEAERNSPRAAGDAERHTPLSQVYDDPTPAPPDSVGASRPAPMMYGAESPVASDGLEPPYLDAPPFEVPRDPGAMTRRAGEPKPTLEALAAPRHQQPADWVAERIADWLLDLAEVYDGVTEAVVRQAADQLVSQYDKARQGPEAPF